MAAPELTIDELITRLLSFMPTNWFSPEARSRGGNLYALLKAFADNNLKLYAPVLSTQAQLAMTSATGAQLDGIARDFFGDKLPRMTGESDPAYRGRIVSRLFLPVGTREGMRAALARALGSDPIIVEPTDGATTGGYSDWVVVYGPLAYDQGGAYSSSYAGAYQALITVQQPEPDSAYFLRYAQIMALVDSLRPAGTTMWVRVIGPQSNGGVPIT